MDIEKATAEFWEKHKEGEGSIPLGAAVDICTQTFPVLLVVSICLFAYITPLILLIDKQKQAEVAI